MKNKGLILVFTGDGKGKTTAAIGTAMRMIGCGKRAAVVQFFKSRKTGEWDPLLRLSPVCCLFRGGGGYAWEVSREENQKAADKAWKKCAKLLRDPKFSLVIFDEIHVALQYRFLKTSEVIEALRKKLPSQHVILTGRDAPAALIRMADLVSEMKCVKHPFQKGIPAQPGIDY